MCFTRSDAGLEAEHYFYQEVLVYVEGYSDIPFYETALYNSNCKIKAKNGKKECEKYVKFLEKNEHPYVVVLDGDYEVLENIHRQHSRVIVLQRYSFESYLFETDTIMRYVKFNVNGDGLMNSLTENEYIQFLKKIEEKFMDLLILDVARQRSKPEIKTFLDSPEKFYLKDFRDDQIQKQLELAYKQIDTESTNKAKNLVDKYLEKHRLIDLLPGHFAFGVIRRFIINIVGKALAKDNIRIFLSADVWITGKTQDHEKLKKHLGSAVREAEEIRQKDSKENRILVHGSTEYNKESIPRK